MKRYILLFIMVLGVLLALTGCGNQDTNKDLSSNNQEQQNQESNNNDEAKPDETKPDETKKDLAETVTLGQYKNIKVKLLELSYTEDDIAGAMYNYFSNLAAETERTTVQRYDLLNIDFVGKIDGEEFEGGTGQGYPLLIGSNSFIDGFEEGMIGAELNKSIDLNLKFPDNYGSSEVQGKDVVFTVTVNEIKEMPEITDTLIAENTSYKTREECLAAIRENMQTSMENNIQSQMQSDLMDTVIKNATFHTDLTTEILSYADNLYSSYEYMASMYQVTLEEYINGSFGMTLEDFKNQLPEVAELSVKQGYVLMAIAEAEKIQVSDEEYNEYTDEMMMEYGYTTREELESASSKENMMNTILYKKALDFVMENAVKIN